jgi:hypothetical protein
LFNIKIVEDKPITEEEIKELETEHPILYKIGPYIVIVVLFVIFWLSSK